jgi:hypothetical protein
MIGPCALRRLSCAISVRWIGWVDG